MENIKQNVIEIVIKAGGLFLETIIEAKHIQKKSHQNFVTIVDLKVDKFIKENLTKIHPGCNIITEETAKNIFDFNSPTWILDPVDGTTNLMHGYNHSSISLGLMLEGEINFGIIYNPVNKELFTGEKGKGAFLNNEKIKVSKCKYLKDALVAFGTTPYERELADKIFAVTKKIYLKSHEIRRTGSAALDLAYVACGRVECFYEMNLNPWDSAAGLILISEAGGRVTDWKGNPVDLTAKCDILASNGLIHEELLKELSE